jgi:hypothetical protein
LEDAGDVEARIKQEAARELSQYTSWLLARICQQELLHDLVFSAWFCNAIKGADASVQVLH